MTGTLRLELSGPEMPIVSIAAVVGGFEMVTEQGGPTTLSGKIRDEHGREGHITIQVYQPGPSRRSREPLDARF